MFRELRRKNQEISHDACIELLKKETRGVLSVLGDDGYPYGMPMNHFYNEADGMIYFHCGLHGHREDALKQNNKVSFCVYEQGNRKDGEWAYRVRSVIVFGKIEMLNDVETVSDITTKLCYKFTQDEAYIEKEVKNFASKTMLLRLTPEHMCGKLVQES
jgi:nitroimidazol reductase NimA-like FMN-containing flavoprotein (pyridoxamine 5'-phosphate oxidase superfamily)